MCANVSIPGVSVDPERSEIDLLLELVPRLRGGSVLEVGCGDGRLTRLYADRASRVLAIDIDEARLARARAAQPLTDDRRVAYQAVNVAGLDPSAGPFDVVIMSWSL